MFVLCNIIVLCIKTASVRASRPNTVAPAGDAAVTVGRSMVLDLAVSSSLACLLRATAGRMRAAPGPRVAWAVARRFLLLLADSHGPA